MILPTEHYANSVKLDDYRTYFSFPGLLTIEDDAAGVPNVCDVSDRLQVSANDNGDGIDFSFNHYMVSMTSEDAEPIVTAGGVFVYPENDFPDAHRYVHFTLESRATLKGEWSVTINGIVYTVEAFFYED